MQSDAAYPATSVATSPGHDESGSPSEGHDGALGRSSEGDGDADGGIIAKIDGRVHWTPLVPDERGSSLAAEAGGVDFGGWVDSFGFFRAGSGHKPTSENPGPSARTAAAADLPGDLAAQGSIFFLGSNERASVEAPAADRSSSSPSLRLPASLDEA